MKKSKIVEHLADWLYFYGALHRGTNKDAAELLYVRLEELGYVSPLGNIKTDILLDSSKESFNEEIEEGA